MSEARRPKGALALSKDIERRVVEVQPGEVDSVG